MTPPPRILSMPLGALCGVLTTVAVLSVAIEVLLGDTNGTVVGGLVYMALWPGSMAIALIPYAAIARALHWQTRFATSFLKPSWGEATAMFTSILTMTFLHYFIVMPFILGRIA